MLRGDDATTTAADPGRAGRGRVCGSGAVRGRRPVPECIATGGGAGLLQGGDRGSSQRGVCEWGRSGAITPATVQDRCRGS